MNVHGDVAVMSVGGGITATGVAVRTTGGALELRDVVARGARGDVVAGP